jgi:hypothetical protein
MPVPVATVVGPSGTRTRLPNVASSFWYDTPAPTDSASDTRQAKVGFTFSVSMLERTAWYCPAQELLHSVARPIGALIARPALRFGAIGKAANIAGTHAASPPWPPSPRAAKEEAPESVKRALGKIPLSDSVACRPSSSIWPAGFQNTVDASFTAAAVPAWATPRVLALCSRIWKPPQRAGVPVAARARPTAVARRCRRAAGHGMVFSSGPVVPAVRRAAGPGPSTGAAIGARGRGRGRIQRGPTAPRES